MGDRGPYGSDSRSRDYDRRSDYNGHDSYSQSRDSRDSSDYRRSYSSYGDSTDRRYNDQSYRGDRPSSGKGYDRDYDRDGGSSRPYGRDYRDGDYRRDSSRDRDTEGSDGRYQGSQSYQRHEQRSSTSYGYSGNSQDDRGRSQYSSERSSSSYGYSDRRYDRSYRQGSERMDETSYRASQSERSPTHETHSSSTYQQPSYAPESGDSQRGYGNQTGVPAELYMPSPLQRGDNHSNLRASEPVLPSPGYRHESSSLPTGNGSSFRSQYGSSRRDYDHSPHISYSRASTQPLEGYGSSAPHQSFSAPNRSSNAMQVETLNTLMTSIFKESLAMASSLPSAEQTEYRTAVEACITSLQALSSSEADVAKTRAGSAANSKQIGSSENSLASRYNDYLAADHQIRLIEGDLVESRRVIRELETPDGDWPEPQWALPPFHGYRELGPSEHEGSSM